MRLEINCQIEKGQLITLYGKSGAGKSSTLRILAGLMKPDGGYILANENIWVDTSKKINLRPQKRKIGFVFQDYALFPNMTVRENLFFALEKGSDKKIIRELIDIIELGELQNRKPDNLSGGQKQRVALARALVQRPQLLMLDEPLSALDHEMRIKLQGYILKVHQEFGLTTILISHDKLEVMKMSDRIFILEDGKIIRAGNPETIFSENKENGIFQINGIIENIVNKNEKFEVSILIGENLVSIFLEKEKINHLEIGNHISLTINSFNPTIQKIK